MWIRVTTVAATVVIVFFAGLHTRAPHRSGAFDRPAAWGALPYGLLPAVPSPPRR
jgi:hypothetical protein